MTRLHTSSVHVVVSNADATDAKDHVTVTDDGRAIIDLPGIADITIEGPVDAVCGWLASSLCRISVETTRREATVEEIAAMRDRIDLSRVAL